MPESWPVRPCACADATANTDARHTNARIAANLASREILLLDAAEPDVGGEYEPHAHVSKRSRMDVRIYRYVKCVSECLEANAIKHLAAKFMVLATVWTIHSFRRAKRFRRLALQSEDSYGVRRCSPIASGAAPTIGNNRLRVTVLEEGGHIARVRISRPESIRCGLRTGRRSNRRSTTARVIRSTEAAPMDRCWQASWDITSASTSSVARPPKRMPRACRRTARPVSRVSTSVSPACRRALADADHGIGAALGAAARHAAHHP